MRVIDSLNKVLQTVPCIVPMYGLILLELSKINFNKADVLWWNIT